MIKKQNNNRFFNPKSSLISKRDHLINYIYSKAKEFNFSSMSTYCGISYMDAVLSQFDVPIDRLELLAMSCLLIAGKFHEATSNVHAYLNMEKAIHYTKNIHTPAQAKKIEVTILNVLTWNLDIQTPYHFVNYFQSKGVVFSTDKINKKQNIDNNKALKIVKDLRNYTEKLVVLALKDYSLYQYTSLVVGASSIAAGRILCGITPTWPKYLVNLTQLDLFEMEKCTKKLLEQMNFNSKPKIVKNIFQNLPSQNSCLNTLQINCNNSKKCQSKKEDTNNKLSDNSLNLSSSIDSILSKKSKDSKTVISGSNFEKNSYEDFENKDLNRRENENKFDINSNNICIKFSNDLKQNKLKNKNMNYALKNEKDLSLKSISKKDKQFTEKLEKKAISRKVQPKVTNLAGNSKCSLKKRNLAEMDYNENKLPLKKILQR